MTTSVFVVDDSATARLAIRIALEADPGIVVVGEAATGEEALIGIARLDPDIVTMDVFLHRESGIEIAAAIMKKSPRPILVVTGGDTGDPALIYNVMQAGALDVYPKPPSPHSPSYSKRCQRFGRTVRLLARVPVVHRFRPRTSQAESLDDSGAPTAWPSNGSGDIAAVVLGASTGGPPILCDLLSKLGAHFPLPIVIVQHVAKGFSSGLADWLQGETGLTVRRVESSAILEPETVFLPAEEVHIEFEGARKLVSSTEPPRRHQRPSIDVLFESAAKTLAGRAIGVIFTGMGSDGAEGMLAMRRAGALTIAQTPATCAVDSMPRRAIELDAVSKVLSPEGIADELLAKTRSSR